VQTAISGYLRDQLRTADLPRGGFCDTTYFYRMLDT
jgi:hypothetical protein